MQEAPQLLWCSELRSHFLAFNLVVPNMAAIPQEPASAGAQSSPEPAAGATPLYVPPEYSDLIDAAKLEELRAWRDAEFSAKMHAHDRQFLNEKSTLVRHLVARNGDVEGAKKCILETMQWRRDFIKRPLTCPGCVKDRNSHCFIPICVGPKHSRPVVYSCQPRAGDASVEPQIHHVVHTIEHMFAEAERMAAEERDNGTTAGAAAPVPAPDARAGEAGAAGAAASGAGDAAAPSRLSASPSTARSASAGTSHQFTWLVDFAGFGMSHAFQARVGISSLGLLSSHLPERLHTLVLINPPSVFDIFFAAVRPFVDARTFSKLRTVRAKPGPELVKVLADEYDLQPWAADWVSEAAGMKGVPGCLPPLPDASRRLILPDLAAFFPHSKAESEAKAGASSGAPAAEKA
jgi:hypothetical protein